SRLNCTCIRFSPAHWLNFSASPPGFSFWAPQFLELYSRLTPACSSQRQRFPHGFCIAHSCRFILELLDWDLPRRCWNCLGIDFQCSTSSDFTPRQLSSGSSFGSASINTVRLIAQSMNMVPAGSFVSVKCLPVRRPSSFVSSAWFLLRQFHF